MQPPHEAPKPSLTSTRALVTLAWEMGYTIALPLVAFGIGGHVLDKHWGTSPLWLLVGMVLAVATTSAWAYQKIKNLI